MGIQGIKTGVVLQDNKAPVAPQPAIVNHQAVGYRLYRRSQLGANHHSRIESDGLGLGVESFPKGGYNIAADWPGESSLVGRKYSFRQLQGYPLSFRLFDYFLNLFLRFLQLGNCLEFQTLFLPDIFQKTFLLSLDTLPVLFLILLIFFERSEEP